MATNKIGWFEIFVNDFDKAKEFYSKLFGWEFKLSQATSSLYWNIYTGENSIGGGLMKKTAPEHTGQSIVLYVEVDDIDKILKQVGDLGGEVVQGKTFISNTAGYYALFRDPDNNLMGLWSMK
jgi:predicted enzyme related to lactoylglutathione lyase